MLGIIGGSGLYELDGLIPTQQLQVQTPFGTPSGTMDCGIYQEQPLLMAKYSIKMSCSQL